MRIGMKPPSIDPRYGATSRGVNGISGLKIPLETILSGLSGALNFQNFGPASACAPSPKLRAFVPLDSLPLELFIGTVELSSRRG
jgi:hypothetical protein